MNCIIIDDDKLSRKVISEFVQRTEDLKLIDTYDSAVDAINSLKEVKKEVELVFLDIEMPDMSGIEFLKNLDNYPQIIIISSKEKYAIDAFEYDVVDYLLKPIKYGRFYKAINKAVKRKGQTIGFKSVGSGSNEAKNEVYIKENSSLVRLEYNDIIFIEALENYVNVTTFDKKYTIHFTMKSILEKLPPDLFIRVHRSFIINAHHILGIEDNSIIVKLADDTKLIPIGKSYREQLYNNLNLITK